MNQAVNNFNSMNYNLSVNYVDGCVYISNIKDICEALGGFNSIFPIPSPSIKLPSFLIHGASCQLHLVIREGPSNYKLLVKSIELFVIKLIMNNFKYQGKRKYINI